jgi:hypothetical protein
MERKELRVFLLATLALGLLQKQAGIEETGIILIYIPGQFLVDYLSIFRRLGGILKPMFSRACDDLGICGLFGLV